MGIFVELVSASYIYGNHGLPPVKHEKNHASNINRIRLNSMVCQNIAFRAILFESY